jgi:hypothetical protein
MLNKYLFNMLNIHLPNMRIDASELYYDRKYRNAPPGSAIDLRYASILRDLGLPSLPQDDALNDALGSGSDLRHPKGYVRSRHPDSTATRCDMPRRRSRKVKSRKSALACG